MERFLSYVKGYLAHAGLTREDLLLMPRLFYYQISVCDYYRQYLASTAANRDLFLQQATFSTKLMRWFDRHLKEMEEALATLAVE